MLTLATSVEPPRRPRTPQCRVFRQDPAAQRVSSQGLTNLTPEQQRYEVTRAVSLKQAASRQR